MNPFPYRQVTAQRSPPLDPRAVTHAVNNLQSSLAETTHHLDALAHALSQSEARELKELADSLVYMTDRCSKLQEELDAAKSIVAKDEESTSIMLQTRLESWRAREASTSPLSEESDEAVQLPMPHILEWERVIELCGTNDFVPQTVYQPYTEADKKRYIREVELQDTIFFGLDHSSGWGISLDDTLKQRLLHLRDKYDPMFNGCGPSVSIRIQWPGYPAWSKQIPTMDFKTPKGPVTRAKLAENIAACIRRFFESVQDKPMEAEADTHWKIGERHIKVEDLILVSLHHVSKGSWQPQLRLCRSFTSFSHHRVEFLPSPSLEQ